MSLNGVGASNAMNQCLAGLLLQFPASQTSVDVVNGDTDFVGGSSDTSPSTASSGAGSQLTGKSKVSLSADILALLTQLQEETGASTAADPSNTAIGSEQTKSEATDNSQQDKFASEMAKLDNYVAEREKEFKAKYGNTPQNMVAVAMTATSDGRHPFVTADQQRLIDSVTDSYLGKTNPDLSGLMDKLSALGVSPDQIGKNAQYFIESDGKITGRDREFIANT